MVVVGWVGNGDEALVSTMLEWLWLGGLGTLYLSLCSLGAPLFS